PLQHGGRAAMRPPAPLYLALSLLVDIEACTRASAMARLQPDAPTQPTERGCQARGFYSPPRARSNAKHRRLHAVSNGRRTSRITAELIHSPFSAEDKKGR